MEITADGSVDLLCVHQIWPSSEALARRSDCQFSVAYGAWHRPNLISKLSVLQSNIRLREQWRIGARSMPNEGGAC